MINKLGAGAEGYLYRTRDLARTYARTSGYVLLAVVVLLAAGLRFYKLGEWSFWGDEFITVDRVQNLGDLNLMQRSPSLLLTGLAISVLGVSEWSARLVPAVIGLLTIPIFYFLAQRVFNSKVALIAAGLLAVSPWHLYWSQNARFYTAMLLFYTLALLLFYLGMEEDRPLYLIGSMLFMGMAFMERPVAAMLAPVLGVYLVLLWLLPSFERPRGLHWRNLALFLVPGTLGGIVVLASFPGFRDPAVWLRNFGFVNNNPLWILGGTVFYLGVPLCVAAAVGGVLLLRQRSRPGLLLTLAVVLPTAAILLISLLQYTANRYLFIVLPAVALLAAVAAWEVWRQAPRTGRWLALLPLLLLVAAPMADNFLYYTYQNGNRDDWKSAAAYLQERMAPGDVVITTHRELVDYYLGSETAVCMHCLEQYPEANAELGDYLAANPQARTWYLLDLTAPNTAPRTLNFVRNTGRFVTDFDIHVAAARMFPMQVYVLDPAGIIPLR